MADARTGFHGMRNAGRPPLGTALRLQARVVWTLLLYEIRTKFGGRDIGYLWTILEPVMIILLLLVAFATFRGSMRAGMEMAPFFASGVLPYTAFQQLVRIGRQEAKDKKGFLSLPQISAADLRLARAILAFANTFVIATVAVCAIRIAGLGGWPDSFVGFLLVIAAAGLLGSGLGLLLGAASTLVSWLPNFMNVVFRLMFVVSGIFFVPAMIPEPYREILLLNPVLHLTEAGRAMFFPNFTQVYGSPIYVIWWILALLFFGMFSDRLVRVRRSRP